MNALIRMVRAHKRRSGEAGGKAPPYDDGDGDGDGGHARGEEEAIVGAWRAKVCPRP